MSHDGSGVAAPVKLLRHWAAGIRFYVAVAAVLITLEVIWWSYAAFGGSTLALIRAQEAFGWISLILIFIAVSIGPFYALFKNARGKALLFDARRLLGVSAAWFAFLHTSIVYFGLFGAPNVLNLSDTYRTAFLIGAGALLVLLAMAFTSFDKAMRSLGKWWFRIHRLVYVAAMLIIAHVFMIGVHGPTPIVLIMLTVGIVALLSMHVWLSFALAKPTFWQLITISYSAFFLVAIMNFGLSQYLGYNIVDSWHGGGHKQ